MTRSIRKHVGARIQAYRKATGITQAALAEAIDCEETTVGRYERGESTIDTEQLVRIAAFFKTSPLNFLPSEQQIHWQTIHDLRSTLVDLTHRIDDPKELEKLINAARQAYRSSRPTLSTKHGPNR